MTTTTETLDQLLLVERVIGCSMQDPAALARLAQAGVSVHEFEHDKHREMWGAILTCFERYGSADAAVVAEALVRQSKWDAGDAKQWVNEAIRSSAGGIDDETIGVYATRLRHGAAMRRARKLADRIYHLSVKDTPAPEIAAEATAELDSIVSGSTARKAKTAASTMDDIFRELSEVESKVERFPLGLGLIDKAMGGGGRAGSVVVIAADTGVGKTTFGQHMLKTQGEAGVPSLYVTFETKAKHLMQGVVQMQAKRRIQRPMDRAMLGHFGRATEQISKMPIWIEDSESMTVEEVQSLIHGHVAAHGTRVVFVDYVQDIDRSTKHPRDDLNYAHISKVLRRAAQRYNVLIVEFAQLADTRDSQKDKRYVGPTEADIAFTRQFAKDASYVVMLDRKKLTTESGGERHRTRVRLTKNRWESTLTAAAMRYDPITTELIPCDENGEDIVEKHEEDDDAWGG